MNELYVDGTGQHVEVHERVQDCLDNGCCIHNPSPEAEKIGTTFWRQAGPFDFKPSHMERICEHDIGHPDPDSLAYLRRIGQAKQAALLSVHGCDGCCKRG